MENNHFDVLLVGAGAMSSTLGVLLRELDPKLKIAMVERLSDVGLESTSGWNNAGTGHAAYCELNYTPEKPDGGLDAIKAYQINSNFEISLQLWSYLVKTGALSAPPYFINPVPHLSFVWGQDNVNYLKKRHQMLSQHHLFDTMEYSDDCEQIRDWIPLVMNGRDLNEPVAATRVSYGTDVNFGSLNRSMVGHLQSTENFELLLDQNIQSLFRSPNGSWHIIMRKMGTWETQKISANFVFLGAGGGALKLVQKSNIEEAWGYGGFPVSGQWLICKKPEVVKQHLAKVYGKASIGAPPMSVPHLDTRIIDGENALLFGPFAGFSTRFLKEGSDLDLFASLRVNNLWPMLSVGMQSFDLIRYLISEVLQTRKSRFQALQKYYPEAELDDWELGVAGQRVQIIKPHKKMGGKLEFGTEVVSCHDGSLAALLGASPGASVAVTAMLDVLQRCFPEQMASEAWQKKMKAMIPSYGESLIENPELLKRVRADNVSTLELYKR